MTTVTVTYKVTKLVSFDQFLVHNIDAHTNSNYCKQSERSTVKATTATTTAAAAAAAEN